MRRRRRGSRTRFAAWFWAPDASRTQKVLILGTLLLFLGALPPFIWRGFVPSPQWMQLAAWLSGLLTLASCLLLWRLHRRGLWQAGEPWPSMGRVKRAFMLPLCLLLAYFCFWLGLAGTLPMAYTAVLGQPAIYPTLAERKRDSGRYSCNYQIKLRSIDYLFFEYCIGSERYGELPAHQQMPVLVQVKRSWFGDSVQSLRLAAP